MARPIEKRKCIKELSCFLDKYDIDVVEDSGHGKGSHGALIFLHRKTGEAVSVTLAGGTVISAGVQRNLVRYIASILLKSAVAALVREAFRKTFGF
jgi:hypothetical protein